uniref:Ubiquitin specific peptidase 45 n=1 Tax=Oryzias sinensis TaxID=183150 RepID=A0A8C7WYV5_9TELE
LNALSVCGDCPLVSEIWILSRYLWKAATDTHTHTHTNSHGCIVNEEIYMLTFLDKHNNYFTLMMLIMGIPVKVSCRLECDPSLMTSVMRRQANIGQNVCNLPAFMSIVCTYLCLQRVKAAILKAFNNPTEKTADEETKRQVKAYGKEGVKLNFVDRIFVGELTNTIMCEECEHISTVKEAFIDISLPIIEEREKGASCGAEQPEEDGVGGGSARWLPVCKMAAAGSLSDGSERDSGAQDSSNDADSEASESEWAPRASSHTQGHTSTSPQASSSSPSPSLLTRQCVAVEQMAAAVSKVSLGFNSGDASASAHCCHEEQTQNRDNLQHHQGAFQALSHSYTPSSKECSIQSCLHQFTSVELLMGNNKLLCESCTERRQKQLWRSEKKVEKIYTSARKQMLISLLPPVIMLHLKRFHQAGMNLRKVNRHVDFPLILDLAPFCSASCKNLAAGEHVLYSLYGIVEHSGSMRGGHYAAYVKVRPPQRRTEQLHKNLSGQGPALLILFS